MTSAVPFSAKASLQYSRACLGICRHCYESTTPANPCHTDLPDAIVALEIAVALLEIKSKYAYDRLCYCAEVCTVCIARWSTSPHPYCRKSVVACRIFVDFWRSVVGQRSYD